MKQLREKVAEAIKGAPWNASGFDDPDAQAHASIQTVLSDPRIVGMVEALEKIEIVVWADDMTRDAKLDTADKLAEDAISAFNQMRSE